MQRLWNHKKRFYFPASANKGKEGKGMKEEREGKGKEGAARKGADLRRGWIDGSMDREESKRSSGGREGRGAGKIKRGNGTKESYVLLIAHGEG